MSVCDGSEVYLGEIINLLQPLLNLQTTPVARDPVHHGHYRLLDHLAADEAVQHLGDLHPFLSIPRPELLHLGEQWRAKSTSDSSEQGHKMETGSNNGMAS